MAEYNNNFEKILPQLWERSRQKEAELKSEYLSKLQAKLLEEIKTHIPTQNFNVWFSGLSIEELNDNNSIILGTNTTLAKEWLELRYMLIINNCLRTVTNSDDDFKITIALRESENSIYMNDKPYTIEQCVTCNCKDFQSKNIELPLGIQGIVSMTVEGFKCKNCGDEFYSDIIKRVIQLFKQRELESKINPIHLQDEEYRVLSARAASDDDED